MHSREYIQIPRGMGIRVENSTRKQRDGSDNMTLEKAAIGQEVKITKVGGDGELRCRLLDMGLIPGTVVRIQKVAPMGDPIEIHLRGYELTIRKEDAGRIEVINL